jgi:hypothetical protein
MGGLSQGVSASARGAEKRGTHQLAQSDGRPRPDGRDVLSRRVGVSRASGSAGHLSGKPIFRDRERLGLVLLVVVGRWVYTERKVLFRPLRAGGLHGRRDGIQSGVNWCRGTCPPRPRAPCLQHTFGVSASVSVRGRIAVVIYGPNALMGWDRWSLCLPARAADEREGQDRS